MKVSISTLFFYEEETSRRFLAALEPGLAKFLAADPENSAELLVTNNAPGDLEKILADFRTRAPQERFALVPRQNEYNEGFGRSHNAALERARGELFVILNNDLFFDSDDWLTDITEPLARSEVGLSGLRASHSALGDDGLGRPPSSPIADPEYLEASALALRVTDAKRLGLFAPDYDYAYQEDVDLSLRFRRAGFKLHASAIAHRHLGSISTQRVPAPVLSSLRRWNQLRFRRKWASYLKHRRFFGKALVRLPKNDERTAIASLPLLSSLLVEDPERTLHVLTNASLLKTLVGSHSRVKFVATPEGDTYDRTIDLENFTPWTSESLPVELSQRADVVWARELAPLLSFEGTTSEEIVLVACPNEGEGRTLPADTLSSFLKKLPAGEKIVVLNPDSLQDSASWLSLYARTKAFIGTDSAYLQLAQLLGIPSLALLGDTVPSQALLPDLPNAHCSVSTLDCLGCSGERFEASPPYCWRRDEACMKRLSSDTIANTAALFLANLGRNRDPAVGDAALALSARRARKAVSVADANEVELSALRRKRDELQALFEKADSRASTLEREHSRRAYRLTRTLLKLTGR